MRPNQCPKCKKLTRWTFSKFDKHCDDCSKYRQEGGLALISIDRDNDEIIVVTKRSVCKTG